MNQPRQSYWKPQHEVFINGMLSHGDKVRAYKEAYPNISPTAVRQAACRLLSYPHIRQRIDAAVAKAKEAAAKMLEEKTKERATQRLLTAYEQRVFLADIILGHMKLRRQVKLRNRVVEAEEDLDPYVVLRAIELDCKLEAGYQWPLQQDAVNRQIDRLTYYLNSLNHQGVGVCKQIETDSASNPPQESILHFARPPFATKNAA
jgi:hypothetical protein